MDVDMFNILLEATAGLANHGMAKLKVGPCHASNASDMAYVTYGRHASFLNYIC